MTTDDDGPKAADVLVLFGITGDLARKLVLPALYQLVASGELTVPVVGVALMVWKPLELLPQHEEPTASLWRQLAGASYVWWAIAVLAVAGTAVANHAGERTRESADAVAVPAVN